MERVREEFALKRLVLCFSLFIIIIAGCQSSTLSFSEIEKVPNEVTSLIDPETTLQLINEENKGSYIVFQSNYKVKADLEPEDNVLHIIFKETSSENDGKEPHVYYLTTDPEHDTIEVLVNGEELSFDEVTGL